MKTEDWVWNLRFKNKMDYIESFDDNEIGWLRQEFYGIESRIVLVKIAWKLNEMIGTQIKGWKFNEKVVTLKNHQV